MTVKYNSIGYLIGEGFRNVFKNKKSTGASLIIMCMAMLIFGIFFMIGENVNHIMSTVGETREGLEDMCARIVALTSMTFQELSSIRAKYL